MRQPQIAESCIAASNCVHWWAMPTLRLAAAMVQLTGRPIAASSSFMSCQTSRLAAGLRSKYAG